MKKLVLMFLLGSSVNALAAVAPVEAGMAVQTPDLERQNLAQRAVWIDEFETKEGDIPKAEDFKELKRYTETGKDENIEFVLKVEKRMREEPEKLMGSLAALNPNMNVMTVDGQEPRKQKLGVSEEELQKHYQQALEILEKKSRQKLGQKQNAPIMMVPTVEEIKKFKMDRYLPEGWEEMLAQSEQYQEEMQKRQGSGKKLDLNDPKMVEEYWKSIQPKQ